MKSIHFLASFGDYAQVVRLEYMSIGTFQIHIGSKYYGQIVDYYKIGWTVVFQNDYYIDAMIPDLKHSLTQDDKDALVDRVTEQLLFNYLPER